MRLNTVAVSFVFPRHLRCQNLGVTYHQKMEANWHGSTLVPMLQASIDIMPEAALSSIVCRSVEVGGLVKHHVDTACPNWRLSVKQAGGPDEQFMAQLDMKMTANFQCHSP